MAAIFFHHYIHIFNMFSVNGGNLRFGIIFILAIIYVNSPVPSSRISVLEHSASQFERHNSYYFE